MKANARYPDLLLTSIDPVESKTKSKTYRYIVFESSREQPPTDDIGYIGDLFRNVNGLYFYKNDTSWTSCAENSNSTSQKDCSRHPLLRKEVGFYYPAEDWMVLTSFKNVKKDGGARGRRKAKSSKLRQGLGNSETVAMGVGNEKIYTHTAARAATPGTSHCVYIHMSFSSNSTQRYRHTSHHYQNESCMGRIRPITLREIQSRRSSNDPGGSGSTHRR